MSIVGDVLQVIKKNSVELKKLGLNRAYSYLFEASDKTPNGKADLMVIDVNSMPETYGSNDFTHNIEQVQIKIFYGYSDLNHPAVNMDAFEDSIASFLFAQNWHLLPSSARYRDPKKGQITKDLFFKRRKIRWKLLD